MKGEPNECPPSKENRYECSEMEYKNYTNFVHWKHITLVQRRRNLFYSFNDILLHPVVHRADDFKYGWGEDSANVLNKQSLTRDGSPD
jgi:hypothetical protein